MIKENNVYFYDATKQIIEGMSIEQRIKFFRKKLGVKPVLDNIDLWILNTCVMYEDEYYIKDIKLDNGVFVVTSYRLLSDSCESKSKIFLHIDQLNNYLLDKCSVRYLAR